MYQDTLKRKEAKWNLSVYDFIKKKNLQSFLIVLHTWNTKLLLLDENNCLELLLQ